MPVDFESSTLIQRTRYKAVYSDAKRGIALAIAAIKQALNRPGLSVTERLELEQALARLKSQRNMLQAGKIAFETRGDEINPPGSQRVQEAEALANQIDNLSRDDAQINTAIDVATDIFKLFRKIQDV